MLEKLSICRVQFKPIPETIVGELSNKVYRRCFFCEKMCEVFTNHSFLVDKLSGPNNFYCSFCLRHDFHTKNNRNILILSFRSIVGHFYFNNYLGSQGIYKLWISEIEGYINSHCQAGLVNPLFSYDPETMLWFINFSKVGKTKRKVPVEEILKTIISILLSFNLSETISGINSASLYQKYKSAILEFYSRRFRPKNRRMLIPTISNCGKLEFKDDEKVRNFTFNDLKIKK